MCGSARGSLLLIPERPALYRFPFGACNAESLQAVTDAGLLAIQWDVATGDPSPHNRRAPSPTP